MKCLRWVEGYSLHRFLSLLNSHNGGPTLNRLGSQKTSGLGPQKHLSGTVKKKDENYKRSETHFLEGDELWLTNERKIEPDDSLKESASGTYNAIRRKFSSSGDPDNEKWKDIIGALFNSTSFWIFLASLVFALFVIALTIWGVGLVIPATHLALLAL